MDITEAKRRCLQIINDNKQVIKEARKNGGINTMQLTASLDNDSIAIVTVLQELENSIPKKKIEDKKQWLEENILQNDYANDLDKDIAEYQVNILQDLLEV